MKPPIAVFAYKRPLHLKAVLEAIERSQQFCAQKLPVTIFCDAPKKEADRAGVEKTIEVAKQWGQGGQAEVVVRPHNFGFENIVQGISELCRRHKKVIVIEDDVVIAPDFLKVMCEGLEKYAEDERIFMLSGFMYDGLSQKNPPLLFLPTAFIWGWATWERAWSKNDPLATGWEAFVKNKKAKYRFDFFGGHPFSKGLEKTMRGHWDGWDSQWMYTMAKHNALGLYPAKSLAWNCGVGGGTHGSASFDATPDHFVRENYIHGNLSMKDFEKPRGGTWTLPTSVKIDEKVMHELALIFLKERISRNERKKWRLYLKLWYVSVKKWLKFTIQRR